MGVKVAALMTEALIRRRLPQPVDADRVIIPGRCRVDLEALSAHFGAPFERGPEELKDLPRYFGKKRRAARPVAPRHPHFRRDRRRAADERGRDRGAGGRDAPRAGADVIDLGCLSGYAVSASGRDRRRR